VVSGKIKALVIGARSRFLQQWRSHLKGYQKFSRNAALAEQIQIPDL